MNELELNYYELYEHDNGFDSTEYEEAYNESREAEDYE